LAGRSEHPGQENATRAARMMIAAGTMRTAGTAEEERVRMLVRMRMQMLIS
jgi:hypothetical protein